MWFFLRLKVNNLIFLNRTITTTDYNIQPNNTTQYNTYNPLTTLDTVHAPWASWNIFSLSVPSRRPTYPSPTRHHVGYASRAETMKKTGHSYEVAHVAATPATVTSCVSPHLRQKRKTIYGITVATRMTLIIGNYVGCVMSRSQTRSIKILPLRAMKDVRSWTLVKLPCNFASLGMRWIRWEARF